MRQNMLFGKGRMSGSPIPSKVLQSITPEQSWENIDNKKLWSVIRLNVVIHI